MMPNEPSAEALPRKWEAARELLMPTRFDVLARHGYNGDASGHKAFTDDYTRLLGQLPPGEAMPSPIGAMAKHIFAVEAKHLDSKGD